MTKSWHQHAQRSPKADRTVDGITFDSKTEMVRWHELRLAERGGLIRDLERQVAVPLTLPNGVPIKIRSEGFPNGKQVRYVADFRYVDAASGETVYEDSKGVWTPEARLKIAVVEAILGIQVKITGTAYQGGSRAKQRNRRIPNRATS